MKLLASEILLPITGRSNKSWQETSVLRLAITLHPIVPLSLVSTLSEDCARCEVNSSCYTLPFCPHAIRGGGGGGLEVGASRPDYQVIGHKVSYCKT